MRNPFGRGVIPRVLAHLRAAPALRDLPPDEADRGARRAIDAAWGRRAAVGDWVACYDWDAIYTEASHTLGAGPAPDVAALVEAFCRIDGMVALLPGAASGLVRLRAAGLRIVALTNGYRAYQLPVLAALGLAEAFDEVLTPDAVGYAKPDPRFFRSAPGLAAHVGDSLVWDVLGANAAGLFSVWLDAALPPDLRAPPLAERTRAPAFAPYLADALERTPNREYHPGASVDSCAPDAVVVDVDEAAHLLLGCGLRVQDVPSRSVSFG